MGFVVLNHKTYLCRHAEHEAGCGITSEVKHLPPIGKEPLQTCFTPKHFLYNHLCYTEIYFLQISLGGIVQSLHHTDFHQC